MTLHVPLPICTRASTSTRDQAALCRQSVPSLLHLLPSSRLLRGSSLVVQASSTEPQVEFKEEEVSTCTRSATATVPKNIVKECFHAAVDEMQKAAAGTQGFRQGKIPLAMIISQYGGQRNFKIACLEGVLTKGFELAAMNKMVVQESLRVTSNIAELEAAFDPSKPLTFTFEYDVVPPLVWKRSYKDLEVTIKDTGNFETDQAAAEGLVRTFLKSKGHQKVAADRGAKKDDTLIMDMKITDAAGYTPLPGLSGERIAFDPDEDPLGLAPHLMGARIGDKRSFQITFPDDYPVELWQGMRAKVDISIREIFEWVLPTFDDEFVKANFPQFESAQDMRKNLAATTAMERVTDLDERLSNLVIKEVVDSLDVEEIPESLLIDMGTLQYRSTLLTMIEKKIATREEVENYATEAMVKEYIDKRRVELEDLIKFNMAVDEIFEKEQIPLEDEEVQAEVDLRKKSYQEQKVDYDEEAIREQVITTIKSVKVVEWLKDNVKRNIVPYEGSS
eukprot:CAMPEP_0202355696 /NCGR_PEP_ID=MMETSP1126-20121109/10480_1 /ASSEMBLY_ACC=CAM_ASM_000457 /TAXON_ID=3047 /ORGANISM="Dunaliella tertiolecta, Strain CCMP1320" /LENGTH=504 /DNA_ID=CAMNT_0048948349 /DNA_START=94 /DNA_END=1608 /DNA_ORIENTATION=+